MFRSSAHLLPGYRYQAGHTLVAASDREDVVKKLARCTKTAFKAVGELIAERAGNWHRDVVFDRGGFSITDE